MKQREPLTRVVRSLRSGQITIPAEFRRQLGIGENSLLQLTLSRGELRLRPIRVSDHPQGSPWLEHAYDAFAAVRAQTDQYSEEDINAAIDAAVQAVRESHA